MLPMMEAGCYNCPVKTALRHIAGANAPRTVQR